MSKLSKADRALVAGISNLVQDWLSEKISTVGDALTSSVGTSKKRGTKKKAKRGRPKKTKKKAAVKKAAKRGRPKKKAVKKKVASKKKAKRTARGQNLAKIVKFLKTKAKGATQADIVKATGIAAPNISLLVKKNAGQFSKTKVGRTTVVKVK
tara:strand:+ start:65 stop:523 length:459 start_codon:yes stop_codon:yes gene_type:complete